MFSGFILELELEFFKYSIRIETRYFNKIEIKPDLILKKAILVSYYI